MEHSSGLLPTKCQTLDLILNTAKIIKQNRICKTKNKTRDRQPKGIKPLRKLRGTTKADEIWNLKIEYYGSIDHK